MRALILAVALTACGGPAPEPGKATPDVDDTHATGETLAEPQPAPVAESGAQPDPIPECIYFAPDALERFTGLRDATHNAAARWWRWYPEGGPECSVRVIPSGAPRVAQGWQTDTISGIRINPNGPILTGDDCSGNNALLVDVLAHELGHVFGFGHFGDGAMAETHEACEPVVPTDDEIATANGCGDWGPPAVADCPL